MTVLIYQHEVGDGTSYQVCVGPFADENEARFYARRELHDSQSYLVQYMSNPYSMAN